MNNKLWTALGIIVGIAGFVLAYIYWTVPSGSLPSYLPGFMQGGTTIHIKHAIASIVVGLAGFAFAWFKSAPKAS